MSTIKWTVPYEPLNSRTFPSAPTGTTTVVATFRAAWKFRFDVPGRGSPDGHTVTYPPVCGSTAVTVSTAAATAPAPGAATCTSMARNAGTAPHTCGPVRVSASRAVTGPTVPAAVAIPARVYPVTSTNRSTLPSEPLN